MKPTDFLRFAGIVATVGLVLASPWPIPLFAGCLLAGLLFLDVQRRSAR